MDMKLRRVLLMATVSATLCVAGCGGTLYATMPSADGHPVMLLGHDPVAYFTLGKPLRGDPNIKVSLPHRTYYFASEEHRKLFSTDPAKYEPQYGGFCSNGTPFKIKLGSDPTEWEIRDGRLFIFGDIVGHSYWRLDPGFNVTYADQVWGEIRDVPWRTATLKAWTSKVAWYRTHKSLDDEWNAKYPNRPISYDPGGLVRNLLTKAPGWRAREGFGQPALGLVGTDACPPACPGTVPEAYAPPWPR